MAVGNYVFTRTFVIGSSGFSPNPVFSQNKNSCHFDRSYFFMERAMGIEPTSKAWEAFILPMNYARK